MERITFENTTVTKQPYVVIDGNEYEVHEGTYSGGTDLDADTFNTLQDNIEDAIDELNSDKASATDLGNISNLTTTDKTSAVAAINEINAAVGLTVHDSYSQSTTEPYSANYSNEHFGGVELYNNTSGTTGNVALSDTATNYRFLDIFYASDGIGHSTRIDTSRTTSSLYGVAGTGTDIWEKMSTYSISGNNLNFVRSFKRDTTISSGNTNCATSNTSSYLTITKVVGYK